MPGLRENIERTLSREPRIDKEFSTLIPPLTPEEYSGLEQSIIAEGCRDAIILWDNIIIDGHNRYKICKEHNIPFRTETKEFASRQDVILWMFRNQLSRRNLNDFQRIEVVRKYEHTVRAQAKQRQGTRTDLAIKNGNVPTFSAGSDTRDILADMAGVGHSTYGYVITILENAAKPVIQAVRNNELSIHAGYMTTKLPPEQQSEISQRIENGEIPAKVVSEVRKRKAANQENTYKTVTARLTLEEYEQVKALARINHTNMDNMLLSLVREALNIHSETH